MSAQPSSDTVGVVGLGIMGSALADNLMQAGFTVVGTDIAAAALDAFASAGGEPCETPRAVARRARTIITSLPSGAALGSVVGGDDGLAGASADDLVVIETSTLSLEDKQRAHDDLAAAGAVLLDCPISGTGAQARNKDIAIYGSGDRAAFERCTRVFEGMARAHHYLGAFGNGSRMKYVANLLVAVHNVAVAERLPWGRAVGSTGPPSMT